ncbi:hypothetical protein Tco_0500996 [Tanacetum coccineum]
MENQNYTVELPISQSDPCSPAANPPIAQCVASNVLGPPESTICMESSDTGLSNRRSAQVAITIEDAPQVPSHASNPAPEQFLSLETPKYGGIFYLLYAGFIVVMFPLLTQLAQLKFPKQSPFETHSFFTNMAVVALTICIPTSVILFAMDSRLLEISSTRAHFYIYKTLKRVFYFSVILAPFSLVLMLLIPHEFNWIGYLLVLVLFIVILACNFLDYIVILRMLERCASKFGSTVQSNEMASHVETN